MKTTLYMLCYISDMEYYDIYDIFDSIELYDENGLRDWLSTAIKEERICTETLTEHNLTKDVNVGELELCEIMEIIQDDGYDIKQVEVNIG